MGTITARRRKDGATADWAQLRGMRDGERVYQEAKAFGRKQADQGWVKRRETGLVQPGAIEWVKRKGYGQGDDRPPP